MKARRSVAVWSRVFVAKLSDNSRGAMCARAQWKIGHAIPSADRIAEDLNRCQASSAFNQVGFALRGVRFEPILSPLAVQKRACKCSPCKTIPTNRLNLFRFRDAHKSACQMSSGEVYTKVCDGLCHQPQTKKEKEKIHHRDHPTALKWPYKKINPGFLISPLLPAISRRSQRRRSAKAARPRAPC